MQLRGQISNQAFFYSATYTPDSTDVNNKGTDYMILWAGDYYSVFESYYGYQLDSVQAAASKQSNSPKDLNMTALVGSVLSMKKPALKFRIHKSWADEQITVYQNIFFDNYVYIQPLKMEGWNIEDQYKEILGFKCQKASIHYAGRDFIAWYSEEIPLTKNALFKDVRKALLGKPSSSVSDEAIRSVQQRYDKSNNPLELVVD